MPAVNIQVPNLIGGVSQLPDAQRDPSQLESLVNGWGSPQDGLRKRPPTMHLGDVTDGFIDPYPDRDRVLHPIDRDAGERYYLDLAQDAVHVYDAATGESLPVADQAGLTFNLDFSYLDVRRRGLILNPEDFSGTGWTTSNLAVADAAQRGPLDKGQAQSIWAVTPAVGSTSATHTATSAGTDAGVTYGLRVYVAPPTQGQTITAFNLVQDFGADEAVASFDWSGTTLTLTGTSWTGTSRGTIMAGVVDAGGGWYEAIILVLGSDSTATNASRLEIPGGGGVRGFDVFGMQHFREDLLDSNPVPFDVTAFPSYHLDDIRTAVRAATFADTTYISNRVRPTAMSGNISQGTPTFPLVDDNAMLFCKSAGYDQRFDLTVKTDVLASPVELTVWTVVARTDTGVGLPPDEVVPGPNTAISGIRTQDVIAAFAALLNTLTGIVARANGSVLGITTNSGGAGGVFEQLDAGDSLGDTALVAIWQDVQAVEDLPTLAIEDFYVRVSGEATRPEDDFWLRFVPDANVPGTVYQTGEPRSGEWEETLAPGSLYEFDAATMPHQLVRLTDTDGSITGTVGQIYFEWGPVTWADRLVGDDLTNPLSTLIGNGVSDLGFYRSRLYLVGDRTVLFSEINEPTSLWRTSVRTLLDGDRIDLEIPDANISRLYAAVPLDRQLVVCSDAAIYTVSGEPNLTPTTVSSAAAIRAVTDPDSPLVAFGDRVLGFSEQSDYRTMQEFRFLQDDRLTVRGNDLTALVQRYLPGPVGDAAVRPETGTVLLYSPEDAGRIYAYQEAVRGDDRLQSAWWVHEFHADARVLGLAQLGRTTGVLLEREDALVLEEITFLSSLDDPDLGYQVQIDRRVDETACTVTYDAGSDTTDIVLPYALSGGGLTDGAGAAQVVTRTPAGGRRLYVTAASGSTITVRGDHTAATFYAGERYDFRAVLTRPYPTGRDRLGRRTPLARGSRRVEWVAVEFEDTVEFDLVVEPPLRSEARLAWRTPLGTSVIGPAQLVTGRARVRVGLAVEDAKVAIENTSPFPSRFVSGEWTLHVERYA